MQWDAFYKCYTTVAHGGIRVAGGHGKQQLSICSHFLIYFAGLASRRWRVAARGFRVKTNKRAWSFMLLQTILLSFEVFTIESKGERERQTGVERVRIGRAAREGEQVIEVWSPWVETVPAWAYREQMTVALVSFAELTVLLPYITPPIVLFQLFGEKS